jgi:hypothetical protein
VSQLKAEHKVKRMNINVEAGLHAAFNESAGPWSVKSSARPPDPVATGGSRQPLCNSNKTSCRKR